MDEVQNPSNSDTKTNVLTGSKRMWYTCRAHEAFITAEFISGLAGGQANCERRIGDCVVYFEVILPVEHVTAGTRGKLRKPSTHMTGFLDPPKLVMHGKYNDLYVSHVWPLHT
jgi:hypothetical protein